MSSTSSDHYNRLIKFVVDGSSMSARELFIQKAITDSRPGRPYSSLKDYMNWCKPELDKLLANGSIRLGQHNMIYYASAPDARDWDVILISTLLKRLFKLSRNEQECIDNIRGIRNELSHISHTTAISDQEFTDVFQNLESATIALSQCVHSPNCIQAMRAFIDDLKKKETLSPNDKTVDILKQWYSTDMEQLKNYTSDLQRDISTVKDDAHSTRSILEKVTVVKTTPSGKTLKKLKMYDKSLAHMKGQFECLLDVKLQASFEAPTEIRAVRTMLRTHHRVVVSGHENSKHLETALAAIRDLEYNTSRCVLMKKATDWIHVCCDEVDLVLITNPFGEDAFDYKRTREMADTFDQLLSTSSVEKDDGRIDIVIVTRYTILQEVLHEHDHDLLKHVVTLHMPTSEEDPEDLTKDQRRRNMDPVDPTFSNLQEHSSMYLQHHDHEFQNQEKLFEAKHIFKQHKMIVISGPKSSGKKTLAVNIMSDYQPEQCLALKEPADWNCVKFGEVSVLLIESFTGKYRLDIRTAAKWFSTFDWIFPAVLEGKLSVILTCEENSLEKCVAEIGTHPLLAYRVTLKGELTPSIKTEPDASDSSEKQSVREQHVNINHKKDKNTCRITGMCMLTDGNVVLADYSNKALKRFNSDYALVDYCCMPDSPFGVCCVDETEAVVTILQTLQFVSLDIGMKPLRSIGLNHPCYGISYSVGELYVSDMQYRVYVYNNTGIPLQLIDLQSLLDWNNIFREVVISIALSKDGNKLYVASKDHLRCIDKQSEQLLWTYNDAGCFERGLCIGMNGTLFMCSPGTVHNISSDGKKIGDVWTSMTDTPRVIL